VRAPAKFALGCLVVGLVLLGLFLAAFLHAAKGFDASKEDPQKLFMGYVQKQMPPTLKIQGAVGRATPMGGTGITFKFELGQRDLDDLISSKHLQKEDSLQPGLFAAADLAAMKRPEFYATDSDSTWTASLSGIRMAVDRDSGRVLYMVFSP